MIGTSGGPRASTGVPRARGPEEAGPLIGVLGAGGAVGGSVAATVDRLSLGRLRLGARRPGALPRVLPGAAEAVAVDATEPGSLATFCAGCQVVVNCAGWPGEARSAAGQVALAAGAHYVDPGGDEALLRELADPAAIRRHAAVLGAGVQPGLSALIPRWLATQGLEPPLSLTAYVGTRDRMTRASAAEFLLSLADGAGGAYGMWRAGARLSGVLEPRHGVSLPFFPGEVVAYPYLSAEAERLARRLPLDEVRSYVVFDGDRILVALSRLQEELRHGGSLTGLADELVKVMDVEMFGRAPAQQLLFQLDGWAGGEPASRVAVLRASSTYELTATVSALTVAQVLCGALPAGAHLAAEVLDPGLIGAMDGLPGLAGLHLLDHPLPDYAEAVQGTI